MVNQLVVLGNGFDLAANLDSRYSDFFKERFEKILTKEDCLKELVHEIQFQRENNNGSIINFADQYLKKNYNYFKEECVNNFGSAKELQGVQLFDLIFLSVSYYINKNFVEWCDIEKVLLELFNVIYNPVNTINGINNDKEKSIDWSVEHTFSNFDFNNIKDKRRMIENIQTILPYSIYGNADLLLDELEKYEIIFSAFIRKHMKQNDYMSNSKKILKKIIPDKADVLSFNYSLDQIKTEKWENINNWNNIHGMADWNNPYIRNIVAKKTHNARLPRPLFGIDAHDLAKNIELDDPRYKFTKDFRTAYDNVNLLNSKLPDEISTLTIYGHSLGNCDYTYFKALFDQYDLQNKLNLEVYYAPGNDSYREDTIFKTQILIRKYERSLGEKGDGLLTKLGVQKRIQYKEGSKFPRKIITTNK